MESSLTDTKQNKAHRPLHLCDRRLNPEDGVVGGGAEIDDPVVQTRVLQDGDDLLASFRGLGYGLCTTCWNQGRRCCL